MSDTQPKRGGKRPGAGPPTFLPPGSVTFSWICPPELYSRLNAYCAEHADVKGKKLSRSEVLRQALEAFLREDINRRIL